MTMGDSVRWGIAGAAKIAGGSSPWRGTPGRRCGRRSPSRATIRWRGCAASWPAERSASYARSSRTSTFSCGTRRPPSGCPPSWPVEGQGRAGLPGGYPPAPCTAWHGEPTRSLTLRPGPRPTWRAGRRSRLGTTVYRGLPGHLVAGEPLWCPARLDSVQGICTYLPEGWLALGVRAGSGRPGT